MTNVFFYAVPYDKGHVTLALESGVDGIIVELGREESVRALSKIPVLSAEDQCFVHLAGKPDEEVAVHLLSQGKRVILKEGWEIIPVENILAQSDNLAVEVDSLDRARLAAGILERGVKTLVVLPQAVGDLKSIVRELKLSQEFLTWALQTSPPSDRQDWGTGSVWTP